MSQKIVDLKQEQSLLKEYVELRNSYAELLLTAPVDISQTRVWLENANIEIRGLIQEGKLAGAVVLYLDKAGEITFFVKRPNQGIGSFLLKVIEEVAKERGLKEVWAWVLLDNTIAQHVFEKNGFIREGIDQREYLGKVKQGLKYRKIFYSPEEMKEKRPIRHTQKNYGIRPQAKEFPMMCVVSFTYICNSRCPNCPYTNSEIRSNYQDQPFIAEDTFRIIADQCGQHQAWIRISGGGEPMLHPQAVALMEYAKKVGAKIGLITNGSCFDAQSSCRLLEAGVDMIEFSVDASDAWTYAKVRRGLDWKVLLDNVSRMVELRNRLKSPTKIIASAINQVDVDIEAVAKFWEPRVDNFQKRKYLTWGINDPSKSADVIPYLPPDKLIPCPFIFERLNIDSRGKVMVCGFDIAAKTDMGNIHEKSIHEIWQGEGFEYYRRMHLSRQGNQIPLCRDCPDWKYRSWQHNYWKIVKNAEVKRDERIKDLYFQESEGYTTL